MIDVKKLREDAVRLHEYDPKHGFYVASAVIELIDRLEAAEQREQALAANLERLRELANEEWEGFGATIQEGGSPGELHEIFSIAMQPPETSLARLKAQWQAEALQGLYNQYKGVGMIRRGALLDKAIELQEDAELRRQAEEK